MVVAVTRFNGIRTRDLREYLYDALPTERWIHRLEARSIYSYLLWRQHESPHKQTKSKPHNLPVNQSVQTKSLPLREERAPQPRPQGLLLLFKKWSRPWGQGCGQQTPQRCRIVQNGDTTGGPSVRWEEIIKWYVNETYANVTLAFERCCVTKIQFTRVCMGILRVCFKYLKCKVI